MADSIRVVALGLARRDGELLVSELRDPGIDETFYRPIGGGVDFGEHSRDAVSREFAEELDVTFEPTAHVGTYETVFTFDGERGHEVQRVYEGEIEEAWPYERDKFEGREPEIDQTFPVIWKDPDDLADETCYPAGLLDDI